MKIASGPNDALVLLWPLFRAQQSLSRAPEKACGYTKRVRLLTWRNFEMCVSHVVSQQNVCGVDAVCISNSRPRSTSRAKNHARKIMFF